MEGSRMPKYRAVAYPLPTNTACWKIKKARMFQMGFAPIGGADFCSNRASSARTKAARAKQSSGRDAADGTNFYSGGIGGADAARDPCRKKDGADHQSEENLSLRREKPDPSTGNGCAGRGHGWNHDHGGV